MNVHLGAGMGVYLLTTSIAWEMIYLKKSFSIEMNVPQNAKSKDASKPTRLVAWIEKVNNFYLSEIVLNNAFINFRYFFITYLANARFHPAYSTTACLISFSTIYSSVHFSNNKDTSLILKMGSSPGNHPGLLTFEE